MELPDFERLADRLDMTDLVRFQDVLSRALVRRFERPMALMFSDMVASTAYFTQHGDAAGRNLQQRHVDLAAAAIEGAGGRIVDTAGDGVFMCVESADAAARAMVALQRAILADNDSHAVEHRLRVRVGIHAGAVLTDGSQVAGETVNLASHIAASGAPEDIRLSLAAHGALTDMGLKPRCQRLRDVVLKGQAGARDLMRLDWLDPARFPSRVRLPDGREVDLPGGDVVRFGRQRDHDGLPANEVVVTHADAGMATRVSRWHFELHRRAGGYLLRSVTASSTTEVDGVLVTQGEFVPLAPRAKVRLGGAVELAMLGDEASDDTTRMPH